MEVLTGKFFMVRHPPSKLEVGIAPNGRGPGSDSDVNRRILFRAEGAAHSRHWRAARARASGPGARGRGEGARRPGDQRSGTNHSSTPNEAVLVDLYVQEGLEPAPGPFSLTGHAKGGGKQRAPERQSSCERSPIQRQVTGMHQGANLHSDLGAVQPERSAAESRAPRLRAHGPALPR
jgi:hypothetical protein